MSTDNGVLADDESKSRIARYDYYYDNRTSSYAYRKSSKQKQPSGRRKYAIAVRRIVDEKGRHEKDVIDIYSTKLSEVLREINKDVANTELHRSDPVASPELMFASYSGLRLRLELEEQKKTRDEDLILDIKAAIRYVEEDKGNVLRDLEKLTSERQITFDLLWALFKPNALVFNYHKWTQQDRLLLTRQVYYTRDKFRRPLAAVECDMIHDDGTSFGFAEVVIEIYQFLGAIPISELEVYPLDFRSDKDAVFAQAKLSGRLFAQMKPHSFHEISGQAMREVDLVKDNDGEIVHRTETFYASGRLMISPFAFRQFVPDVLYNPPVRKLMPREGLKDEEYAICTPVLLGFSFERKLWGGFAMSRLKEVVWNDDAFDALVLGEKQKWLIHALVREHSSGSTSNQFDDVIEGKGRGLIGLLAGKPGCGKTLTAEAVAETTRRPLYTVSAGELGATPEDVEKRLVRVLEVGQMWNAVLLLDEAELFLQQRDVTNVTRNALVSIFLRQLEYYQGILILTTNMPEQCDAAFESRIHFSVNYPDLDFAARRTIWSMFFKRSSVEIDNGTLDRLATHGLNGRQIKNVFSSALTISRAKGETQVGIESVDAVLSVLNDWRSVTRVNDAAKIGHVHSSA